MCPSSPRRSIASLDTRAALHEHLAALPVAKLALLCDKMSLVVPAAHAADAAFLVCEHEECWGGDLGRAGQGILTFVFIFHIFLWTSKLNMEDILPLRFSRHVFSAECKN
jgi:hypothetical protein